MGAIAIGITGNASVGGHGRARWRYRRDPMLRRYVDTEPDRTRLVLPAGAVIALGIYVLFRAMQLFFGAGSQDNAATVSTSVFLLAALGLASGFCAREAVAQIEGAATRILHHAESGRDGDGRGTSSI